jgi:TRAP-type C4-dicarboxylate transport system permease small subunit
MIIGAVILALITISIAAESLLRTVFDMGWSALEEFPRLFIVYLVFPLMGVLYKNGRHISVDVADLYLQDKPKVREGLSLVIHLAMLAGASMLLYGGVQGVKGFLSMGYLSVTEIAIPLWTIYLALPIGYALLILICIDMSVNTVVSLIHLSGSKQKQQGV